MIFVNNDDVMGKNIHALRCRRNLSAEEFSKVVGMDPAALYAIENGKNMEIEGQLLENICRFFHTDIESLVEKTVE